MEIVVNDSGPSQKTVKITISKEDIDQKYAEQLLEVKNNAVVPGFRNGKAPKRLLERKFGKNILLEMKGKFLAEGYEKAIDEHKLAPISEPDIDVEKLELVLGQPLVIEFDMEVQPEFELPEYKGVKAKRDAIEVTDEDVENALKELQQRKAELVPVESGASEEKDVLVCEAALHVGDEKIWSQDNFMALVLDTTIMGIEVKAKKLTGCKSNDLVKIKGTLPKDFKQAEYSGKKAELSLKVLDVKRILEPELNDEFAEEFDAKDMDDLRAKVKHQIEHHKEDDANQKMEQEIVKQLVDAANIDLPAKFVEDKIAKAKHNKRHQLADQGMSKEEIDKKIEDEKEDIADGIREALKQHLIIEKIAEKEELDTSAEELDEYIENTAKQQGQWPNEVRNFLERHGLIDEVKSQLKQNKVFALLRENADVS